MTIDLRYIIPIIAACAPWAVMTVIALALGFKMSDVGAAIAFTGILDGGLMAGLTFVHLFLDDAPPILWRIPFTGEK